MRSMKDEGLAAAVPSPDPHSGATLSRKGRGIYINLIYRHPKIAHALIVRCDNSDFAVSTATAASRQ
jgi:hypothetical protein